MNTKIKHIGLLVALTLVIMAGAVQAQGNNTGTAIRAIERELDNTERLLERAQEYVRGANVPQAGQVFQQAVEIQKRAREQFQNENYLVARTLTRQARERAKLALSQSRQSEQYEGAVLRKLERAAEILGRVRQGAAQGQHQRLGQLLEVAEDNLARAWEFYRQGQYKPAYKLANQIEENARKLIGMGSGQAGGARNMDRWQETTGDMLQDARDAVATCESVQARTRLEQAEQAWERAGEMNRQNRPKEAVQAMRQVREMAKQAVAECQDPDRLQKRYRQLEARAERVREQIREHEGQQSATVDNLMSKNEEQLRLAREHLTNGRRKAATAALQAADLTLSQAERLVGQW